MSENIDNSNDPNSKKHGFLPFALMFGGFIVLLALVKFLLDYFSK